MDFNAIIDAEWNITLPIFFFIPSHVLLIIKMNVWSCMIMYDHVW
jgi:hypothetical protein